MNNAIIGHFTLIAQLTCSTFIALFEEAKGDFTLPPLPWPFSTPSPQIIFTP